jgi:hypothetical protein
MADYYELKFSEIKENGGFKVSWNWFAFMFVWMWYFSKGMWAKGLAILFLMCVTFWLVLPLVVLWLYCGLFGNYDYYLLKTKNKQLW